jgi:small subunit ribosomal protein S6
LRKYEAVLILDPNLEKEDQEKVIEKIKKVITKAKGNILKVDDWGKRKLAYLINYHTHGFYYIINYDSLPETSGELENAIKLSDKIIRYIIVRGEG